MNNQSQAFVQFIDNLNTANLYKSYFQAYLTIKRYAFSYTQNLVQSGRAQLFNNECVEYDNQYQYFNQEINSVGGTNAAFLNKENYEVFISQIFSKIDFNICDLVSLNVSNNLMNAMTQFGNLPDKFANHQKFVIFRISQLNQLNVQQIGQNVISGGQGQGGSQSKNVQINDTKNIDLNTKTTDYKSLINKSIKLPVKKGTNEYNNLKNIIKEHLTLSEQEALYNKMDYSKAHLEAALYYLKNIIN